MPHSTSPLHRGSVEARGGGGYAMVRGGTRHSCGCTWEGSQEGRPGGHVALPYGSSFSTISMGGHGRGHATSSAQWRPSCVSCRGACLASQGFNPHHHPAHTATLHPPASPPARWSPPPPAAAAPWPEPRTRRQPTLRRGGLRGWGGAGVGWGSGVRWVGHSDSYDVWWITTEIKVTVGLGSWWTPRAIAICGPSERQISEPQNAGQHLNSAAVRSGVQGGGHREAMQAEAQRASPAAPPAVANRYQGRSPLIAARRRVLQPMMYHKLPAPTPISQLQAAALVATLLGAALVLKALAHHNSRVPCPMFLPPASLHSVLAFTLLSLPFHSRY